MNECYNLALGQRDQKVSIIFSEGMGEEVLKGKDEEEEEKNKLESSTEKREQTYE